VNASNAHWKVDWKGANEAFDSCGESQEAFRVFRGDSPYEQALLHGWHAIQSRGGRRQLRHCASTCLFAICE